MKLTIKTGTQLKEIDLNKDLSFNVNKGEQYVFSNGFTNYVLNFKDDQESIILVFNISGKNIQVELNGIVPLLQNNTNTDNPTSIIINKNVDNNKIEEALEESAFNGSEILDKLEQLASLGVNTEPSDNLALISDFQTLIGALDAAAAGPEAAEPTSDGSTFNSILNPTDDSLPGIAETDRWENLSESISSTAVSTAEDVFIPEVSVSNVTVNENDGEIVFNITLSAPTTVLVSVDFSTSDGTAEEIKDYLNSIGTLRFFPGETVQEVRIPIINDNIYEASENFFLNITNVINATIADAQGEGTILDNGIPTLSITGSEVVEGEYANFDISLSGSSYEDITFSLQTKEDTATQNDYSQKIEVFVNGQWVESTTATIPAGEDSIKIRVKTIDDVYKEPTESFSLEATIISGTTTNTTASGKSFITDDTTPTNPPSAEDTVYAQISVDKSSVEEGGELTYTVKLVDKDG
ncbi:Calx-beta domain-containing protein, partial [Arcobacter sp. YIC-80]|uniref:Calx-beta domain-containing protein n=1 Tax=Arcobacter sp. YIC-80 TaxID=3376683 RepID=UPI00384B18EC